MNSAGKLQIIEDLINTGLIENWQVHYLLFIPDNLSPLLKKATEQSARKLFK